MIILEKSNKLQIRAIHGEYNGKPIVHVREWYLDGRGEFPEWKPSPKGFTLTPETVAEFAKVFAEFAKE